MMRTPETMMTPVFVTDLYDVIPLTLVAADELYALVAWLVHPLREAFVDLMAVNVTDIWVVFGGIYILIFTICMLDHHHTSLYNIQTELTLLKTEHMIMAKELKELRKTTETRTRPTLREMTQTTMKLDGIEGEKDATAKDEPAQELSAVKTQCAISFKRLVSLEKKVKNLQQTVRLIE